MDYRISKLDNGLEVTTLRTPGQHRASIGVQVGSGSRDEVGVHKLGTAHYLEHLLCDESAGFPDLTDSNTLLRPYGGYMSASTSEERTDYYIGSIIGSELALGLRFIADHLQHPLVHESAVERHRSIINDERRLGEANKEKMSYIGMKAAAYAGQPIEHWGLGPWESLKPISEGGISRDDLLAFHREHYVSGNVKVVVTADRPHEEMVGMVGELFYPGRAADYKTHESAKVVWQGGQCILPKDGEKQCTLTLAFPGLSKEHSYTPAMAAFHMMRDVLNARLFENVAVGKGMVYKISAGSANGSDFGYLNIQTGIAGDKVPNLLEVIYDELNAVAAGKVTDQERKRVFDFTRTNLLLAQDNTAQHNQNTAWSILRRGKYIPQEEWIAMLEQVTLEQMVEAARHTFSGKLALVAQGDVRHVPDVAKVQAMYTAPSATWQLDAGVQARGSWASAVRA